MQRLDTLNIGEVFRDARESLNLTQEEVGDKLGLGRDAIIRIEKGTRKITLDEIRMLFQLKKADLLAQNKKYHYILENYEVEEKELLKKKEHFTR